MRKTGKRLNWFNVGKVEEIEHFDPIRTKEFVGGR